MVQENTVNDFSKGSVVKNILTLALPMTLAQLINILYNIVDRMYIGRIPDHATLSLTGLGLSMPIISAVIALFHRQGKRRYQGGGKSGRQCFYHAAVHRCPAHCHGAAV